MAEVVKHYKLRIDAGVPGARDEFNTFLERRKIEAAEQVESAAELKERIQEMQDQLIKERTAVYVQSPFFLKYLPPAATLIDR